ncbi:integrase arm-type DNA-binding domain-containing protein [Halomonas sp. DP5N14-9]|uniref:tyrosine-type recombinase/integrase n=1 Tax=Halomonas sp. DP5N14-9 TaxID=2859075 RepID=UPI001C999C90|nr:integrase arm-type DNA-binding domain-containing protein [Halomonas sp. DP5N14-9]MBY5943049.1 integrase arm-type DNA-binding domain-containing protein [Halomonas sp. DP5N14-9]
MSRQINKLSATAVKTAKPKDKTTRMADGGGLYLEIRPTGSKYWRMKYRFAGKEKLLAIGTYPDVTLADARKARDKAKEQLAEEVDPSMAKQLERQLGQQVAANTFQLVAQEWLERVHQYDVVPDHYQRNRRRLERDAFPVLGKRPLSEITAAELLTCLRRIEERGHVETAHRVKTLCGQVFRYGISTGRAERDPTPDLRGALRPSKTKHYPALTDPKEVAELLRAIDGYGGQPVTIAALKLAPLVFTRPGELRQASWVDIDLEAATWTFEASKTGQPLIVPLPTQAVDILSDLYGLTGRSEFVFPGARSNKRPMSNVAMKAALDRMGFKNQMTVHGFRAMARTILAERLGYPENYIEQQLAHTVRDPNGRAYNRTQYLDQRREMLQSWANYLDQLRT